jgi:hypothetical protein
MADPNPRPNLGTINRLRASIMIPDHPELNVSASGLTKAGIRLAFEGDAAQQLPQMVGMVISQEPYMKANIAIGLVKTSPLVALWKARMELDSRIGDVTFISDTTAIPAYVISNVTIQSVEGIDASGASADYPLMISGTYFINSNLFNL